MFSLSLFLLPPTSNVISEDTIDESYGVPVVFHEDEEEGGGRGEVMEVQEEEADEEEEGVETEYEGVLHAGVSRAVAATGGGGGGAATIFKKCLHPF